MQLCHLPAGDTDRHQLLQAGQSRGEGEGGQGVLALADDELCVVPPRRLLGNSLVHCDLSLFVNLVFSYSTFSKEGVSALFWHELFLLIISIAVDPLHRGVVAGQTQVSLLALIIIMGLLLYVD